jgi:phosphoheptose isomerase
MKNKSLEYYNLLRKNLSWLETIDIDQISKMLLESKMVFTAGNGGSSGNAAHLACEIQKGCSIPAICLNESTQLLTAWSNDYHYNEALAGQYKVLAKSIDLPHTVVVFSGSGNSKNIYRLAGEALDQGADVIALTGYDMNSLDILMNTHKLGASLCIGIPKEVGSIGMQVSEDLHAMLCHMIYLDLLEKINE